ncbi:hypothetical protein YDYSY3_18640 [Paenibacillus chitinolyticus]|uniref:hypothetical protein n=1 Tax=Paenibacillus chitinolyticus TaxID=79263 RepID=UPI0026E4F5F8|nr:hypothetical protein [Paenibacillus chitinolyticus]GKS10864.1 hypothetical protein YDYSY3_18640 [Paenibacillus chitinolyticus]
MAFNNKSDQKGFSFEYDVFGMFQSQGYLVRRGVPLSYGNDATDIDVMGIVFTSPFQGHRIICDCKNKVKAKPFERIFWAKGLGEFVKASNVFVALNKTQWEIIRFAASGGVKIVTSDTIEEYRKGQPSYGLADGHFYTEYEQKMKNAAKASSLLTNILVNTKKLYLHENPYVAVNICMEFLSNIAKGLEHSENHSKDHYDTLKYLACELTVLVGLQLLWICSDVLGLPEKARREHISSKLTYGELDPGTAKNIINTARDLANEIIRASVPKSMMPKDVDFGNIVPPPYTSSLIGLIERALARPNVYLSMPQHLDFLLFEQGIKDRDYSDDELIDLFGYTLSNEKFKVSRNILSFVREACGLDWKSMWRKGGAVQPAPREVINADKPVEPSLTVKGSVDGNESKEKAEGSAD